MEQKELTDRFNRIVKVTMPKNEWDSFFATGVQHTMHDLALYIIDIKYRPNYTEGKKVYLLENYTKPASTRITFIMPDHEYKEYAKYAINRYSSGATDVFAQWYVKKHDGSISCY